MKLKKNRGFTIVELVIVIAVIAILAAVLIPTFSGVIEKANTSADIQLVRQANTVLAAMEGYGTEITPESAKAELKANGINMDTATPNNENNEFYFIEQQKCYVIWGRSEGKILFPEGLGETLSTWTPNNSVVRIGSTYYASLKAAVNAANAGDTIVILKDIEASDYVLINKDLTVNFNGYTYKAINMQYSGSPNEYDNKVFIIDSQANVEFKSGKIMCSETGAYCIIQITKGNLAISNMCIDTVSIGATEPQNKIRVPVYGLSGSLVINDTTMPGAHNASFMAESEDKFELTITGQSVVKTIYLRFKTIYVDIGKSVKFDGFNLSPNVLLMKLEDESKYPDGCTWSEPDEDGYRTYKKSQ